MKFLTPLSLFALFLCIGICNAQTSATTQNGIPSFAAKYNNQVFGNNTFIFDPQMDMKEIQTLIDSLYSRQHPRSSEFGDNRYALMFKPGNYQLDIKVGYYMSIIGLGESPNDVVINGLLISKGEPNGNVTCNFWRSVENITFAPPNGALNIWGVSQAAPMRRTHIKGDIQLHDQGWASGGFLADSKVDDTIYAGGQQQWFTRNTEMGTWDRGSWNMLFMGVSNTPKANWPHYPYTVIDSVPVIREKPYVVLKGSESIIKVPALKKNSSGVSWLNGNSDTRELLLKDFYIAKPDTDSSQTINAALSQGRNIFFTPGIYKLNESLKVTRSETVIMGIGMATLKSGNGNPVLEISDVNGVTVCGLIIDAGELNSETLVRVGDTHANRDHTANPAFLHDIFIRVGGYGKGNTSSCMIINSDDVIVDHTWLWRADHGKNVGWTANVTKNGLIVNGDRVTVYGLFCEHFHEYQTLWNGNAGRVYFYQSEMPYDPPTSEAFMHGTTNGYASYKVSDNVKSHEAWALGIYCVFFKAPVIVDQAIETPPHLEKDIHHKLIYWLYGGHKESKIKSVINGKGGHADVNTVKTVMK
jgi:hypothetical protein